MISRFRDDAFFLSNMFPWPVHLDGEQYFSVEHAFQAAKTLSASERRAIQQAKSGQEAKRLGRQVTLRPNWNDQKVEIMRGLLQEKFSHHGLRQRLLDTGSVPLVEGNTWGDKFWGCVSENGSLNGLNRLGRILMDIRAEAASSRITTS
jgi:hypothetical protein